MEVAVSTLNCEVSFYGNSPNLPTLTLSVVTIPPGSKLQAKLLMWTVRWQSAYPQ